ncbi:helix-turn-helix domain-containing protein [Methylobacterium flocculans]|uniref:helix-turn-helix domain-containing protein n=1 Tax=Methylobacterium flocculans TaxID=2984843 RepID=UPI00384ED2D5
MRILPKVPTRKGPLRKLTLRKHPPPDPPPPSLALAPETIGQRIKALREAQGMTQGAVAKAAGMKRPDLSDLETGKHDPTFGKLRRIARGLGVPLTEVVKDLDLEDN